MKDFGWIVLVLMLIALLWGMRWTSRKQQAIRAEIERKQIERDGWDFKARLCGNCTYWPLSRYYEARKDEGGKPSGQGGNQCDGTMSDCRAALPGSYEWPGYGNTRWPQTKRDDGCKHFEQRDWLA